MSVRGLSAVCLLIGLAACGRSGTHLEDYLPLGTDTAMLRFSGEIGEAIPPQTVALTGVGAPTDTWTATALAPWVVLDPPSATGLASLVVSVRTRDLAPGSHLTSIRLETTGPDGETETAAVAVELILTSPGWGSLSGPYAGQVNAIAVDPGDDRHVIAGNYRGRLFASHDGGATFGFLARISPSPINDLALTAIGRGYAVTDGQGAYISTDGGVTWVHSSLQGEYLASVAVSETDDLHALAVGGGNVWRTTDGGESWTATAMAESPSWVGRNQGSPGELIVGAAHGVFYLTDGVTYEEKGSGHSNTTNSVLVLPNGDWLATNYYRDGAGLSSDQGETWTTVGAGLPGGTIRLAFDGTAIWAATWYGGFLSEDDGASFNQIPVDFRAENETVAMARAHPDGTLFAHRTGGVVRHVPGSGLVRSAIFADYIVDLELVPATGKLFGVGSRGTGFVWTAGEGFVRLGGADMSAHEMSSVVPDPRNGAYLCLGVDASVSLECTEDGGANWRQSAMGIDGHTRKLARAVDDPDVLWARTSQGLFRSTDNGISFSEMPVADGFTESGLAVISRDVVLVTGGAGARLGRFDASTGLTEVIDGGNYTPSLVRRAQDGSLWYGSFDGGLHRSDDNGLTFTPWGDLSNDARDVEVDPTRPGRVYVGTLTGLFVTNDAGSSWTEVGSPFGVTALAVDPGSGEIFAGTDTGGIYRYFAQ